MTGLQSPQSSWPEPRHPSGPGRQGESLLAGRQKSPVSRPQSFFPKEMRETHTQYSGSLRPPEVIPFLIRKFSAPFFRLLFRTFTLYIWKGGGGRRGKRRASPPSLSQARPPASSWGRSQSAEVRPPTPLRGAGRGLSVPGTQEWPPASRPGGRGEGPAGSWANSSPR